MFSSNSTTFFVTLPSNVKDYVENKPNSFRVHMPKRIELKGDWMCALQSIQFPYSWPPSLGIENDQWIEIHLKENVKSEALSLRIPVPNVLFDSPEELVAFLNDLINENLNSNIRKSRKRRNADATEQKSKAHKIMDKLASGRQRAPSPPPPLQHADNENLSQRAPSPPPPLQKPNNDTTIRSEMKSIAHEIPDTISNNDPNDSTAITKPTSKSIIPTITTQEPITLPEATSIPSQSSTPLSGVAVPSLSPNTKITEVAVPVEDRKDDKKERAPAPPPHPTQKEEPPKSIIHKIIDRIAGEGEIPTTKEVEIYEEPKAQERGVLKEFFDTLTFDIDADELRVSEQQIQALVEGQAYVAAKEKLIESDTSTHIEKANENVNAEVKSIAHRILDKLRTISNENKNIASKKDEEKIPRLEQVYFDYLNHNNRITLVIAHSNVSHISISTQLSHVLGGFSDANHVTNGIQTLRGSNISKGITGFAVCAKDLTEPTILGNKTSSLLRIVSVEGHHKPGHTIEKIYDSPMFMRVLPREINEIGIDILTLSGDHVPFIYGTVIITLIFKRIINF
jgi:hypothetical protein